MISNLKKLRRCCTSLYRAEAVRYGMMIMMLVGGLLFTAQPAAAQLSGQQCLKEKTGLNNPSCTANDVRIGRLELIEGPANCDPEDPTPFQVKLRATIESAPERFDIGIWVNEAGNSARSDTTGDNCYRDFLHPLANPSTTCEPDGPYYTLDGDSCGDLHAQGVNPCGNKVTGPCTDGGGGTCLFTTFEFFVDIVCKDSDGDGTAEVGTCTSWDQNAGSVCTNALGTDPGTGSKCNCNPTPILGLHTGCTVEGQETDCDDQNPCTDDTCSVVGTVGTCVNTPVDGRACGDSTDTVCDDPDTCDANGVCQDNNATATTTCRASAGQCDVAESCDGAGNCPADGFAAATTACTGTSEGGACDGTDSCDGSGACVDGFAAATTPCRASAGACDVAESCTGSSGACPADGFAAATTTCVGTSNGGACDGTDSCDGSGACVDGFAAATTPCRASAGACDVAESCTGSSGACPADGFAAATTTCVGTSNGGACDGTDSCDGSGACVDGFAAATTPCRASAGACDVAESCTGSSGACPADGFAAATTTCVGTSNGGACDGTDSCDGSGACVDGFAAATTPCRASAGACDVAESCTGSSGACPTDGFAAATTICRPSQGGCDIPESCTANGVCPGDVNPPCAEDTQIAPTATTCEDFRDGTAADLNELLYGLRNGAINSISPGVLFLYDGVSVTVANSTITVEQTDGAWNPRFIAVHQGQVVLYNALTCTRVNVGSVSVNASGDVTITGVPIGEYILGIKYDPTTLKGFVPPTASATYSFAVAVNGGPSGSDSIDVNPKP